MNGLCIRIENLQKRAANLNKLRQKKENAEKIKELNNTFRKEIEKIINLISIMTYIKQEFGFVSSEQLTGNINMSIQNAKQSIYNDELIEDYIVNLEKANKETFGRVQKEWKAFYAEKFSAILKILNVAQTVKAAESQKYQGIIKNSEKFVNDILMFQTLKQTIDESNDLISSLDLDDDIKLFLKKMSAGRATLLDLDDKIIHWIKDMDLTGKVRLSFMNKP